MPYSWILRSIVARDTPSARAARAVLPAASCRPRGDHLALVGTDEVVREVRSHSPDTDLLAVAATQERARACEDAGATVVLTGAVAADDLVGHLLRMVGQRPGPQP